MDGGIPKTGDYAKLQDQDACMGDNCQNEEGTSTIFETLITYGRYVVTKVQSAVSSMTIRFQKDASMTKTNDGYEEIEPEISQSITLSVVLGICLVLLLAVNAFLWWRRMKSKRDKALKDKQFHDYLDQLGLSSFFPGKMELVDIMTVTNFEQQQPELLTDIPFIILKNIIMKNCIARDEMLDECLKTLVSESQNVGESCGGIDALNKTECRFEINPIDLTVALFKCASPSLVQTLSTNLSICQLAIPFVLPTAKGNSLLSTWPLRSIILKEESSAKSVQHMALDCPCHVVGFLRLGRPTISKSQLINETLSDQHLRTFSTQTSPIRTSKRMFSDGLIELTWYQPSEISQIFKDVLLFLNLRGDASMFISQLDVMRYLSSIAIVLIEIGQLKEDSTKQKLLQFHETVPGLILAVDASKLSNTESAEKELEDYKSINSKFSEKIKFMILAIDGKPRSFSDITKEIRNSINELSKDRKTVSVSEKLKKNKLRNIDIDENSTVLRSAKQNAEKIVKLIPENSLNVKEAVVPLQGKPWQEWSEQFKTLNKSSRNLSLQEEDVIKKEMKEKRRIQKKLIQNSKLKLVRNFVNKLTETLHAGNGCIEFILYIKSFLDKRSMSVMSEYLAKDQADFQGLKTARDDIKKDSLEKFKNDLDKSEMSLAEASFGLEHLLKELGQIYEAFISNGSKNHDNDMKWCEQLPYLCAELLLKGQPFEIMDVDVFNVPLLWVNAVLTQLKLLIGDKKMLALSVFGIQNSGKSTLLNTMFGLNFGVSDARFSRGVFMQLVPVQNGIFPFDYVLVINTEGLRAPALALQKQAQVNELAEYVIGLGDITIVNIKGVNSTEVKDVLTIAVRAFVSLNKAEKGLNLKRSCYFVHQNVPTCDNKFQMMPERDKLIETLNETTKEVANQQNLPDIISFNQIVSDFDMEKHVWYFPDLWQGDSPMAPVNPGYSISIREVKNALLFRLTKERKTYLTITDTITRIEDLWNGIITDDFVFSLRNSLESKAFSIMENRYQESFWEMEKFVSEFVAKQGQTVLLDCESTDDFKNAIAYLIFQLSKKVKKQLKAKKTKLDSFIERSTLADIMIKWSPSNKNKLTKLVDKLTLIAEGDINELEEKVKKDNIKRHTEINHEKEIIKIACKTANENKGGKPSDEVVKEIFETMWNKSNSKITEEGIPVSPQRERYKTTVCSYFTNVIRDKTVDTIAAGFFREEITHQAIEIINHLLTSSIQEKVFKYFSYDKYSLIKTIMTELAKGDCFENVKSYIEDPSSYTSSWLENFTYRILFEEKIESDTQFILIVKPHVEKVFSNLSQSIQKASGHFGGEKEVLVSEWRDYFLEDIRQSHCFPLPNDILVHTENETLSDVQSFSQTLTEQMGEMEKATLDYFKTLNKSNVQMKENRIPKIMEKLWGCTEKCMFCKEPCKITDKDHCDDMTRHPHQCIQHRPQGIGGWHDSKTEKLIVEFCNYLVKKQDSKYISQKYEEERLYKDYQMEFPEWDIQPTLDTSKYWMWIMCKYEKELKDMYKVELPDIPSSWREITQQEAFDSL